jgi:spermidine synthase
MLPLFILGSGVAIFAAAGALVPAGLRELRFLTGSTATSWTAYAVALLGGLALAGSFGGRRGSEGRTTTARLVTAECLAAAALAAAPLLLRLAVVAYVRLWPILGGTPLRDLLLRLLAAGLVAMPPSAAIGVVFQRLVAVVRREDPRGEAAEGFVLGMAGGAVGLGLVCGGILLPPALGARGAVLVAIGLAGLGAAAGTLALRIGGAAANDTAGPPTGAAGAPIATLRVGIASGVARLLIGAGMAVALIAWLRIAGLLAGPTEASGLAILIAVVLGLALGGFVSSGLAWPSIPWIGAALTAAAGAAIYLSMHYVPALALTVLGYAPQSVGRPLILSLLAAGLLALPACVAAGWGLVAGGGRSTTGPAWLRTAAIGAAIGTLGGALALVPLFGLRRTLAIAAAALLAASAAALIGAGSRLGLVEAIGALALAVAALAAAVTPSAWDPRVVAGGIYRYGAGAPARFGSTEEWLQARLRGEGPRFYREGSESTVVVERSVQTTSGLAPIDTFTQTVDGRAVAGTGTDLRTQVLTGAIPPLLHGAPKKALLVDLLTGVTAGSLLTHPIESLTVIEPESSVAGAAALFADFSNRPLDDARIRILHDDARSRLVADPARYDLIVYALADPSRPEGAALLTAEAYALAKGRLNPGGLVAERIPLGGIPPAALPILLRTFAESFASVLVFALTPDDLLLVGSEQALRLDGARLREVVGSNPAVADDLRRAVVVGANEVIMTLRLDRGGLLKMAGAGPIDHDDTGLVGGMAARHLEVQHHEGLMASIDAGWPGFDAVLEHYGSTPEEQGTYLYSLAKSYLGIAADPVRALDLARLLEAAGQTVPAHWVRGEALLQQHDLDGAVREWKAALAGKPDDIDSLFSLGTFYLDSRDYQLADLYLAKAASDHPDSKVVRYHYGRTLYNLGRYQRAIEELDRATSGEGGREQYPLAGYFIGLSEWQLKHDDQAITALKDYLVWAYKQSVITRVEVDAHFKLAEVYDHKGKRFDALQERQKAERLRRRIEAYAAQHPSPQSGSEAGVPTTPADGSAAPPPAGSSATPPDGASGPAPGTPPSAPAPAHGG